MCRSCAWPSIYPYLIRKVWSELLAGLLFCTIANITMHFAASVVFRTVYPSNTLYLHGLTSLISRGGFLNISPFLRIFRSFGATTINPFLRHSSISGCTLSTRSASLLQRYLPLYVVSLIISRRNVDLEFLDASHSDPGTPNPRIHYYRFCLGGWVISRRA